MATKIELPDVVTLPKSPDIQYVPGQDYSEKISNAFAKYWNVVLWNDDVHSYEYVMACLMQVVGCTQQQAFKHADTVHHDGKSIVASETREKAELYVDQLKNLELTVTLERNS